MCLTNKRLTSNSQTLVITRYYLLDTMNTDTMKELFQSIIEEAKTFFGENGGELTLVDKSIYENSNYVVVTYLATR